MTEPEEKSREKIKEGTKDISEGLGKVVNGIAAIFRKKAERVSCETYREAADKYWEAERKGDSAAWGWGLTTALMDEKSIKLNGGKTTIEACEMNDVVAPPKMPGCASVPPRKP